MNKKRVLITGSNGYIGTNLSRIINQKMPQAEVFGIDVAGLNKNIKNDHIIYADISQERKIIKILNSIEPDLIFHLAGVINSKNWEEYYIGNVHKTKVFLDIISRVNPLAKIIVPGSAAEYGRVSGKDLPVTEKHLAHPVTLYGLSKHFQTAVTEYYCARGLNVVIGRIFNFIGQGIPDYMAIGTFSNQLDKIKNGKLKSEIQAGNLKAKRDYLDIHDICTGLIALARNGRKGEIYNICSGYSIAMNKILRLMIKNSGLKVKINIERKRFKKNEIPEIFGSNTKICRETGWKPEIPIDLSIRKSFTTAG